jgi:hypothetical protein
MEQALPEASLVVCILKWRTLCSEQQWCPNFQVQGGSHDVNLIEKCPGAFPWGPQFLCEWKKCSHSILSTPASSQLQTWLLCFCIPNNTGEGILVERAPGQEWRKQARLWLPTNELLWSKQSKLRKTIRLSPAPVLVWSSFSSNSKSLGSAPCALSLSLILSIKTAILLWRRFNSFPGCLDPISLQPEDMKFRGQAFVWQ